MRASLPETINSFSVTNYHKFLEMNHDSKNFTLIIIKEYSWIHKILGSCTKGQKIFLSRPILINYRCHYVRKCLFSIFEEGDRKLVPRLVFLKTNFDFLNNSFCRKLSLQSQIDQWKNIRRQLKGTTGGGTVRKPKCIKVYLEKSFEMKEKLHIYSCELNKL